MKPYIHADDIGMSPAVTDHILDAIDNGIVTSVSLVTNGRDSQRACEELLARPHIAVSLHLNLSEGFYIADTPRKGQHIVSGFEPLFFKNFMPVNKSDVLAEIEAQIAFFAKNYLLKSTENAVFRLDSHHHTHCIPFVFDKIVEVADQYNIKSIRVPNEAFFFRFSKNYLSVSVMVNYIKKFLLQALSWRMTRTLRGKDIEANRRFVGIIFTGFMAADNIRDALKAVKGPRDAQIEVLLHPGGSTSAEKALWAERPALWAYYSSEWRGKERDTTKSEELKKLLEQYS